MEIQKICVIHLNQIGDLVFSLPVLKALKGNYPGAVLHCVVKPYLKGLLIDSPFVDDIVIRPDGIAGRMSLAQTIRRNRYDLLISLARSEEAMLTTALSSAGIKAGFVHFPWDFALHVKETVAGHNCWKNNARLLRKLGIHIEKNDYVGLLSVRQTLDRITLPEKFVVISAGASRRRLAKAWDEEKFAELIVSLHDEYDLAAVLVGAGDTLESNALIMHHVSQRVPGRNMEIVDLAGRLDLRELYALLARACLFVGIDSGVMHMASAADIPVVALFGPTDPDYVGPQNRESIVVREDLQCVPCYLNRSCREIDCMRQLGADRVMDACRTLMDGYKTRL